MLGGYPRIIGGAKSEVHDDPYHFSLKKIKEREREREREKIGRCGGDYFDCREKGHSGEHCTICGCLFGLPGKGAVPNPHVCNGSGAYPGNTSDRQARSPFCATIPTISSLSSKIKGHHSSDRFPLPPSTENVGTCNDRLHLRRYLRRLAAALPSTRLAFAPSPSELIESSDPVKSAS